LIFGRGKPRVKKIDHKKFDWAESSLNEYLDSAEFEMLK